MSEPTHAATRAARPRHLPPPQTSSTSLQDAIRKRLGNSVLRRLLEELVRNPAEAHRDWKTLSEGDRSVVANTCGEPFANAFDQPPHKHPLLTYLQPRMRRTAARLRDQGYCFGEMESTGTGATDVEHWLHPSGDIVRNDVSAQPAQPQSSDSREGDEEDEDAADGVRIETKDNVTALTLPEDPSKLLRIVERGLDKLAGYCGADPYEVFDGIEDSREFQNELDEFFKSVRQIELVVGSALGKLSGIGSGAKNLPPRFSQRVAAAKKQHELIGKQCCSVGIKGASFGCPADQATP